MLDFSRQAARYLAAIAAAIVLVSCGGSDNDTPAAPPLFQTTVVVGASGTDIGNALAAQVVPGLRAASPGLNIYYADVGALSNSIAANPANYGITNTTAPCYAFFTSPAAPICATPAQYMFWDELHPSAAVHALIAQAAFTAIGR